MEIKINNGGKLVFSLESGKLIVQKINSRNEVARADWITSEELVLLYDYYIARKNEKKPIF